VDEQSHFECNMPCIPVGDASALPPSDASGSDATTGSDAAEPQVDAAPPDGGANDP
jgi:hypothetical protein